MSGRHTLLQENGDNQWLAYAGTFTVAILIVYIIKNILQKPKEPVGTEEIPTPKGALYYLGHIPLMNGWPAQKIAEWHRELGPIIKIKMGVQNWVFVSDPKMAQDIFSSMGTITSGRPYLVFGNGILGEGGRGIVFADYGKKWKNARTAVLSILAPKVVDKFAGAMEKEAARTIDVLIEETIKKGAIDPVDSIRCCSMNNILLLAFGTRVESSEDPLFKELVHMAVSGGKFAGPVFDFSAYFPILSFLDIIFRKEHTMREFVKTVTLPIFARLVKIARENDHDSLVKQLDKEREALDIDERNLLVIMAEVFVAGSDTVTVSLMWTCALLCIHQDIQKKLRDEIDIFISRYGRLPSFADRLELPYYTSFQKEVLRFRPPTSFGVPRKASEDFAYMNYVIPKGTTLVTNNVAIHSEPNNYSNADKFEPERFIDDTRSMYASSNGKVEFRDNYIYGWGRRICPGIYLAENEMFNFVIKLLATCIIEAPTGPDGNKIYPDLNRNVDDGVTVLPGKYNVHFIKRTDSLI